MEIIARSRAAIKNAADFTPSVRPSRPLVTTKEVLKVVVPITLLGVSAVSCGPQPEAATPIAKPTNSPQAAVVESTATTPPPAINESVKTAVGENEYGEIATGTVKGKDYATGKDFDGTVEASSIKATNYNDVNFSYVVTGEATDANGKKFAVIWNEVDNYWYKNENINPNLESTNRTNFDKQLPGMVDSNDLYRMLLTQMDTTFPEDTQTARFWMVPRNTGTVGMNEYIYTLDMSRADNSDDGVAQYNAQGEDLPDYQDIRRGSFTQGKEPYRVLAMIDGVSPAWTDKQGNKIDGKEISVIPVLVQNSDGKGMIWFVGMDAVQREDLLTGPDSAANGYGIQNLLTNNLTSRLNLVIPPADEAMWDNYEKNNGNNGGIHFRGSVNFKDDAIIAMQDKPGVFHNLLPADMQRGLDDALTEVKDSGGQVWHAVPFEGNALPSNVIKYLSNHMFEIYFDSTNGWNL
jgi:hypothetical protein